VYFLHCKPTFCLLTEMGKFWFMENYLMQKHISDYMGCRMTELLVEASLGLFPYILLTPKISND
jgi:hypothetical protein